MQLSIMKIKKRLDLLSLNNSNHFFLIAGPCVIESEKMASLMMVHREENEETSITIHENDTGKFTINWNTAKSPFRILGFSRQVKNSELCTGIINNGGAADHHIMVGDHSPDFSNHFIDVVIDVVNIKDNNLILFEYNGKNVFIPIVDDFVELFDLKNKIIKVKNIKTLLNL